MTSEVARSSSTEYQRLQKSEQYELQDSGYTYGATEKSTCPDSNLTRAVLAVILCCPVGVLALSNSLKVKRRFRRGDALAAQSASEHSQHYTFVSFRAAFMLYGAITFILLVAIATGILSVIERARLFGL